MAHIKTITLTLRAIISIHRCIIECKGVGGGYFVTLDLGYSLKCLICTSKNLIAILSSVSCVLVSTSLYVLHSLLAVIFDSRKDEIM